MLVHHKSLTGNRAIISFILQVDPTMDDPNVFFDAIKPDLWRAETGFEASVDEHVNLDLIVPGGAK